MLGNGRMVKNMVKEHTLFLIEVSMQVSLKGTGLGTSIFMTKKVSSYGRWWMEIRLMMDI